MNDYKPVTNELDLFLLFYELDRLNYLLKSRLDNGVIPETSIKHVQAVLKELGKKRDWAFTLLSQFSVEPFKTTGATITEEYRAWYKWWKDYFMELAEDLRLRLLESPDKFPEEERKVLTPTGSWRDLIGKC